MIIINALAFIGSILGMVVSKEIEDRTTRRASFIIYFLLAILNYALFLEKL